MNNLPLAEDLKLFCAVVRNLSFVATANEWGCSPAFVTKRIALLESALRVRLLHRTTGASASPKTARRYCAGRSGFWKTSRK